MGGRKWQYRLEDVKKLKNRCGVISALKKVSPGFPINDRRAGGIHFVSSSILAKSIFSHLPVHATSAVGSLRSSTARTMRSRRLNSSIFSVSPSLAASGKIRTDGELRPDVVSHFWGALQSPSRTIGGDKGTCVGDKGTCGGDKGEIGEFRGQEPG
jgi:hypothetical protein